MEKSDSKKVHHPARDTNPKKSFSGAHFFKVSKTRMILLGIGISWLLGTLLKLNVMRYCVEVLQMTPWFTFFVLVALSLGVALGYYLALLLSRRRVELGIVPIGAIGYSLTLSVLSFAQLSPVSFIMLLAVAAFFIGLFKRPFILWINERISSPERKKVRLCVGAVSVGFAVIGMLIFGVVNTFFSVTGTFKLIAVLAAVTAIGTLIILPAMFVRFLFLTIAHACYNIKIIGGNNIPKDTGVLIISNHLSIMDSFLLVAAVPRMLRFVMMEQVYRIPVLNYIFKKMNMVPVGSGRDRESLSKFNGLCATEIKNGHVVCIFPEGQLSRIGQLLEFKKGMEHIAQESEAPIIPIYMDGVAGNGMAYSKKDGRFNFPKLRWRRRKVTLTIGEPMPYTTTAFEARNKMEELSVSAFATRDHMEQTLGEAFLNGVAKKPHNIFEIGGEQSTFKELGNQVVNVAFYLKNQLENHTRVAIVANESMDAAILNYALLLIGKEVVNVNTALKLVEVRKTLLESKSTLVICDAKLDVDGLVQLRMKDCIVQRTHPSRIKRVLKRLASKTKASNTCMINFEQEFSAVTHQNILSAIHGIDDLYHTDSDDKIFCPLPLWSNSGAVIKLWLPIVLGINLVERLTHQPSIVVGPQACLVSHLSSAKSEQLTQIKFVITGSESLPQDFIESIHKDVLISQTLGFEEGSPVVSINRHNYMGKDLSGKALVQQGDKPTSVGRAIPGVAIKVVSFDGMEEAKPNEEGLVAIKNVGTIAECMGSFQEKLGLQNGWFITSIIGKKCKAGFITLS